MNICHIIGHSCVRVHKLAWAQKVAGRIRPMLFNSNLSENHPTTHYDLIVRWPREEERAVFEVRFMLMIQRLSKMVDAFHIHNAPDWPVVLTGSATRKPIFWDVHDLMSWQKEHKPYELIENQAAKFADHIFTVGTFYQDMLSKRFDKPVSVYRSLPPRAWYPEPKAEGNGILVYAGGVSDEPGHHRDFLEYFGQTGAPIDVFPANGATLQVPANVRVQSTAKIKALYHKLSTYEAGFVGTARPHRAFMGSMPNKLFEYIAAGIPIIAANAPDVDAFLDEVPIGCSVESPEEIPEALAWLRRDNIRARVREIRDQFCMDLENETVVEPVYREVIGG